MISYLSLGTNLGDRAANLDAAIALLSTCGRVLRQSTIYETVPQGFQSNHLFLNMCVAIDTPLSPQELLLATQDIERQLGRTNKSRDNIYTDRVIDIDILLYEDYAITSADLTIPHPRMLERAFVRQPLEEIYL